MYYQIVGMMIQDFSGNVLGYIDNISYQTYGILVSYRDKNFDLCEGVFDPSVVQLV